MLSYVLLDNPLANLSQLSQLCHPPSSCPSFGQVPGVVTEWEKEKVLMLCNHSLAIVINAVLVTDPKQPKRGFCEENQHLVSYPGVHSSVCIVLHPDYISNHTEPTIKQVYTRFSDALIKNTAEVTVQVSRSLGINLEGKSPCRWSNASRLSLAIIPISFMSS